MREVLDPWIFIWASYGVGLGAVALLVGWSWLSMKRAERRRDEVRGR
ncbi:MAG: heme exporter protein CcmD [Novosphingobium sp.]|nr:heme exporter protein CcmD [Novosphingobium sp.]